MRRNSSRGFRANSNRNILPEELEIKDLDLELELLRRKREILEQKAQSKQQYGGQGGNSHDFSYLYEDSPPSSQYSGRKRYVEDNWDVSPPPPKRVALSRRGNVKPFDVGNDEPEIYEDRRSFASNRGNRQAPSTQSYRDRPIPLMSVKTKPSVRNFQSRPWKSKPIELQPSQQQSQTKIPKNKGDAGKTKPALTHGTDVNTKVRIRDTEDLILRADKVPSQQMAGRLELALGNIMKTIKTNYSEKYAEYFESSVTIRNMKQLIRQRIRNVMIGKVVHNVNEIVDNYRAVYPLKTDIEIVTKANNDPQNIEEVKETIVVDQDDHPSIYFKRQFSILLEQTLDEMFAKLSENYAEAKYQNVKPIIDAAVNANSDKDDSTADVIRSAELTKPQYYDKLIKSLLYKHIPDVLPKYKRHILRMMNLSKFYKRTKAEIKERTTRLLKQHGLIESTDETIDDLKSTEDESTENKTEDTSAAPTQNPTTFQRLPYYVKIVGRPSLPKRHLMQKFLDDFEPKSIKKVKQMGNLLFVGFDNKENFDRIVEANNTVIGTSKLIIKISKWVTKEALEGSISKDNDSQAIKMDTEEKNENIDNISTKEALDESNSNEENNAKVERDTGVQNDNIDDISFQSIDDQIDSLLGSIRRENESSENNEDNAKQGDVTTENTEPENETTKENLTGEYSEQLDNKKTSDEIKETVVNKDENVIQKNEVVKADDENLKNVIDITKEVESGANTVNMNANTINIDDVENEGKDKVGDLKASNETARGTPTRSSSRLANTTPSTVKTRRASRLAQDN